MPNDIFSLLDRHWIPVLRASGAPDTIRPADITSRIGDDPVVAIAWGRPDLDAATREFLIGLLATACGVDARDRWHAWFNNAPASEALDAAFAPLAPAFILDGAGPHFQQDLDSLGDKQVPVSQLFIEAPGDNTVGKNLDHFVHRGGVETLSRAGAAIALHCLQTFAPAGGAGNRTSLRGGGPLTTLLAPGTDYRGPASLWRTLCLNVLPAEGENDDPPPRLDLPRVFPWLAPTRVSDKGLVTTPEDVDPLQAMLNKCNLTRTPPKMQLTVEDAFKSRWETMLCSCRRSRPFCVARLHLPARATAPPSAPSSNSSRRSGLRIGGSTENLIAL